MGRHDDLLVHVDAWAGRIDSTRGRSLLKEVAAALRDEIANGDRLAHERDGWQEEVRRLVGVLVAVRSAVLAPYLDPNAIARSIDLSLSGSVGDANTLALAAHRALRGGSTEGHRAGAMSLDLADDEILLLRRHHYTWKLMASAGILEPLTAEEWKGHDPEMTTEEAAALAEKYDAEAQAASWRYNASMEALFAKVMRAAGLDPDDGWEPGVAHLPDGAPGLEPWQRPTSDEIER